MSEAPKRIWAWPEPDDEVSDAVDNWGWAYGDWDRCEPMDFSGVQYVRVDLFAALEAEKAKAEAERDAMQAALREIADLPDVDADYCCVIARNALEGQANA